MKAYVVRKGSSGFDGLQRVDRAEPVPTAGQVLVRMRAASVNYRDIAIVRGRYMGGAVTRDTVALSDGAGEVEAVGDGVSAFQPGDRVMPSFLQGWPPEPLGSPLDGVLAEYAVFAGDGLVPIPGHLSFEEAASLPCAGVTAWNALTEGRSLRPGETVLTLGTGGVSIFVLQLAKAAGARVIVTSSSDAKLESAAALGADGLINYKRHPEWEKEVCALTHGHGADKLIELGGPGTLPRSYQAVAAGGEIALIGVMTRPDGDLSPYPLLFKRASLRGIFVGGRSLLEGVARALAVNDLKPVIDRVFEFDEAGDALPTMKAAEHFGKLVIRI